MTKKTVYEQEAWKRWRRAIWIVGDGPWASVSRCPRGTTVQLYGEEAEALRAKRVIDGSGCSGACVGRHEVVELRVS